MMLDLAINECFKKLNKQKIEGLYAPILKTINLQNAQPFF